jgi:hypothetical protein
MDKSTPLTEVSLYPAQTGGKKLYREENHEPPVRARLVQLTVNGEKHSVDGSFTLPLLLYIIVTFFGRLEHEVKESSYEMETFNWRC